MGLKVGKRERPGGLMAELARRYRPERPEEVVTPEEVLRDREAVQEGGLRAFVRLSWPLIDPAPFRDNWHVGAVCEHLDACGRTDIKRLLINVPPGTSKSSIAGVQWPSFEWTRNPVWALISASYAPQLATRDARRHRDLAASEWYRARWPRGSVESFTGAVKFENAAGGSRLATTPGSLATGYHSDAHLVDDPIKPRDAAEARSTDVRARLAEVGTWWGGTMSTRAKDQARLVRVIVMQRLHDVDLTGLMMLDGGWEHLVLPMEYDPKVFWHLYPEREKAGGSPHCETSLGRPDPRREEGELLDPGRFPREVVDSLRAELKEEAAAQLDQVPVVKGGGLFRDEFFARRWRPDTLPRGLVQFSSWDLRFKDDAERGSFVTGEVWGLDPLRPDMYLLHQVRGRWGYAETKDQFRAMADDFPQCLTHLVENKANGPALKSDLEAEGYQIELVDPMGSKVLRANVAEPYWRAGRVHLPEGAPWVPEFVREHVRFPRYRTDDQVDCASQAVAWAKASDGAAVGHWIAGVLAASAARR